MALVSVRFIGALPIAQDTSILILDDVSYVQACNAIRTAIHENHSVEILVQKKLHHAWLKNYLHQLAIDATFSEETIRSIFSQRLAVAIPDWVRDDAITSQNLLDLELETAVGSSFEDRLLSLVLDNCCIVDLLNAENAAAIVTYMANSQYQAVVAKYPLVTECLIKKVVQWKQHSNEQWIQAVCDHLPNNPLVPLRWFGAWSLLQKYPDELLERVFPVGQIAIIRSIPIKAVAQVYLEPTVREEALTQIQLYLEQVLPIATLNNSISKVVAGMSGRLLEEYKTLLKMVKNGSIALQTEDVALMLQTFSTCPGVGKSHLQALTNLVRPKYPTLIGNTEAWDATQWVEWTIKEYSAYREWQVRNNKFDADIETAIGRFSDWYINEYPVIHANPELSITYSLNILNTKTLRAGLTIILVVDCLPVMYTSLLDDAMRNAGFNLQNQQYRFAILPTVTEFNKAALLSGSFETSTNSYAAALAARSARDWNNVTTYYVASLKNLSELSLDESPAIIVMNYIEGDEILHSDVESKNRTYEEELTRVYTQLADTVRATAETWTGPREDIQVLLVTDHGACRILEEDTKTFSSNILNKLFEGEKHRMATMSAAQAANIPDNVWDLGYRFSSHFSTDDLIHFLPRGHNTVRKAAIVKGYHHGGATPEEVIVPFCSYGLVANTWKKPLTRFTNLDLNPVTNVARFFIQRVVIIEIEVQNLNPLDLQILSIEAVAPDSTQKDVHVVNIQPATVGLVSIALYFQKTALMANLLELKLHYTIGGTAYDVLLLLPSEFKSATAPGLNLRNL